MSEKKIVGHVDPSTHAEHLRLLNEVVAVSAATHVAQADGNWTNAATWTNGVPTSGAKVHIPAGRLVAFDAANTPDLNWVRIDGALAFSNALDTAMTVDTLAVADAGRLEIGKQATPITKKVTITIKQVAPQLHWSQIDRGLIVLGNLSIWGVETTSWVKVAKNPRKGDASIQLAAAPKNWQAGGQVIVPGVLPHVRVTLAKQLKLAEIDPVFRTQHELLTVTSISGTTLKPATPLASDTHHQLPEGRTIAVGYLNRNITIQSADIANRGHVMIMPTGHNKRFELGYFALVNMGRTHTELHVTDPQLDLAGVPIPDTLKNPRARYALHFHKMGDDHSGLVKGVAVVGSLKWGIVNHGSIVDVEDCVSWDCDGAHYATESGQERGSVVRNMGVRSQGFGRANNRYTSPRFLGGGGQDKIYTDRQVNVNARIRIAPLGDDFGFAGYGIWLQGPLIKCEGNELYGAFQSGITIATQPVGTDNQGEPIVVDRDLLPPEVDAALPGSFGKQAPLGYAPLGAIPFTIGPNNIYGSLEALVGMDNVPPKEYRSRFIGGCNYNCHVGQRNWESLGQIAEGTEFLNYPTVPGQTVTSFYDGSSAMILRNIKALNFRIALDVPQVGTNIIEGEATLLQCQQNIHFQAETNASNLTYIYLAEKNFGLPTAPSWPAAEQLNIAMDLHTSSELPQRHVEWHRPNVPAVRLWSNPAFAPEGHFTIPKFNGVATEL